MYAPTKSLHRLTFSSDSGRNIATVLETDGHSKQLWIRLPNFSPLALPSLHWIEAREQSRTRFWENREVALRFNSDYEWLQAQRSRSAPGSHQKPLQRLYRSQFHRKYTIHIQIYQLFDLHSRLVPNQRFNVQLKVKLTTKLNSKIVKIWKIHLIH